MDTLVSALPSPRPSSVVKSRGTQHKGRKKGSPKQGSSNSHSGVIATDSLNTAPTLDEIVSGARLERVVHKTDKGVPIMNHPHTETEEHYRMRLSRRKSWVINMASDLETSIAQRSDGLDQLEVEIKDCQTRQKSLRRELVLHEKRLMAVDTKEQSEILDVVKVEGGVETNEVADGSSLYNSMPTWAMNVNEEGRDGDEDCGNGGTTTHSKDLHYFPTAVDEADQDARSTGALSAISGITANTVKSIATQASSMSDSKSDTSNNSDNGTHGSSPDLVSGAVKTANSPKFIRSQRRREALERGLDTYEHDGRTYSTLDDALLAVSESSWSVGPNHSRQGKLCCRFLIKI